MSTNLKKLTALALAGCMAFTSVFAMGGPALLETTPGEASGTICGDPGAKGGC